MKLRFVHIALLCGALASVALPAACAEPTTDAPVAQASTLPRHTPRVPGALPIVAVVAENEFTELTDYVVPYGVLAQSGVAQVFALATQAGPVQLFPALKVQPPRPNLMPVLRKGPTTSSCPRCTASKTPPCWPG
jgi:putative intracellular protease/amidase